MKNFQKLLIVATVSVASLLAGLLVPALVKEESERRSLDGLFDALGYGSVGFVIGIVISVILAIKLPSEKLKNILFATVMILTIEIVVIVLGNLNNWWR